MYCRCGKKVHPVRLELGYKTCVDHSTTQTYSYVPIIEHKTGNTIQIVSQEVSASVHRAWRRKQLTKFESTLLTTKQREEQPQLEIVVHGCEAVWRRHTGHVSTIKGDNDRLDAYKTERADK